MDIGKDLRQLLVGFMMGMSKADRQILSDTLNTIPEYVTVINTAPKEQQMSFLQGIKNGRLSEQQLQWFYKHLDAMDEFHRKGGAMKALGLITEETKLICDDVEYGYETQQIFQNKYIENSLGEKHIPTLVLLRNSTYKSINLEDYCTEVNIKKSSNFQHDLIAEFYCNNYKNGGSDLSENLYDKLKNNYSLQEFTNIQAFNATRSTATRNSIDHSYRILSFYKIKELNKGLVVKFYVEEL